MKEGELFAISSPSKEWPIYNPQHESMTNHRATTGKPQHPNTSNHQPCPENPNATTTHPRRNGRSHSRDQHLATQRLRPLSGTHQCSDHIRQPNARSRKRIPPRYCGPYWATGGNVSGAEAAVPERFQEVLGVS